MQEVVKEYISLMPRNSNAKQKIITVIKYIYVGIWPKAHNILPFNINTLTAEDAHSGEIYRSKVIEIVYLIFWCLVTTSLAPQRELNFWDEGYQ